MSTQDANAGAELRRKAALPQLRGVHLADGCMYVHCSPRAWKHTGVCQCQWVWSVLESADGSQAAAGSSGTQRDGGDVHAGVVTFSVCGRGTKDYNLRVLILSTFRVER